ncbi:MAG: DUF1704 domain-containing protein, partial [Polyangiaceae bacterium]|nr:DUF1704 domain-containing protein [Polyangiaceae bacterium]
MREARRDAILERASRCFDDVAAKTRLLDGIQWSRKTEREFFQRGGEHQPEPTYEIDASTAAANLEALDQLDGELAGHDRLLAYLRAIAHSYRQANEMLLSVGTRRFYEISLELYGGASTLALDHDTSNLDLAKHLARRIGRGARADGGEAPLSAEQFQVELETRLAHEHPALEVKVVVDDDLAAKVIAGAKRVRIRAGATFSRMEVDSLFVHEIETHSLTAQNGLAQSRLPFLRAGGPRTTRTQEGLAVFAELFDHSLSIERLRRLVERVNMVAMAEDGASFLDIYRYLTGLGVEPRDAYLDTARIFRGGVVDGGAPFTKDAAYLAGLAEVYNFLRVALNEEARHVAEVLVSGRLALDDLDLLLALREEGVLLPPVHLPRWLRHWDGLLPYFAFTSD